VLVVDDEDAILRSVCRILASQSIETVACSHPQKALELLREREFSAVISDYRMPTMDGVALLTRVKSEWPETARILITAYADLEIVERGINDAGIQHVLHKPFSSPILANVVAGAVRNNTLRRERVVLLTRLQNLNEELVYVNGQLTDRIALKDQDLITFRRQWDVALDAILDPITIIDENMRITGANAAACQAADRDRRDLTGRQCFDALFDRAIRCEACPLSGGNGRLTQDRTGSTKVYDVECYRLPSASVTHICVYRDVSQQVAFERETAHAEKMTALGRLVSNVAHEINNPLQAIFNFAQIAEKPDTDAERLKKCLSVIRDGAMRCRDYVQVLRNFSRRDAPSEKSEIDLTTICSRALVLFASSAKAQVKAVEDCAKSARCIGNGGQLLQVLTNLIQNAVDASPPNGSVRIGIDADEHRVMLWVEDDGPGIPESERGKIFEPFYTTKPEGQGTGLGLAISERIVHDHGGEIVISSAPSGGARFTVKLPHSQARIEGTA